MVSIEFEMRKMFFNNFTWIDGNTYIESTDTTTYTLTNAAGCDSNVALDLTFNIKEQKLYIPDIFTPGGDGINDNWYISVPAGMEIISCKIYNRWGELLYSTQNEISWDGTYKGSKVSSGVYVYLIEYRTAQGESKVVAGDLTVVR